MGLLFVLKLSNEGRLLPLNQQVFVSDPLLII